MLQGISSRFLYFFLTCLFCLFKQLPASCMSFWSGSPRNFTQKGCRTTILDKGTGGLASCLTGYLLYLGVVLLGNWGRWWKAAVGQLTPAGLPPSQVHLLTHPLLFSNFVSGYWATEWPFLVLLLSSWGFLFSCLSLAKSLCMCLSFY